MMLIKNKKSPVLIGLVAALALAGCEGNSSSSSTGPLAVITPIKIDKTIADVDWNSANPEQLQKYASHAYRAIAQHSMLATVYSGQSGIFKSFISLVQQSRNRSCNVSGSMVAELETRVCEDGTGEVDCKQADGSANPDASITTTGLSSVFYQCQDGEYYGRYLNGPLKVLVKDDFSVQDTYTNTSTISAEAMINKQNPDGSFVTSINSDGDTVVDTEEATDFLFQNDYNAFLISHEYNLETVYDTSDDRLAFDSSEECTTADKTENGKTTLGTSIVTKEAITSDKVAALQDLGERSTVGPQFPYTEFTDLELVATKDNYRCEDLNDKAGKESLRHDTTYSLTTKISSKVLGKDTQFDWTELDIPYQEGEYVKGTITLTHTNSDNSDIVVTAAFDGNGNVSLTPSGSSLSVEEFLALSKPEPATAE